MEGEHTVKPFRDRPKMKPNESKWQPLYRFRTSTTFHEGLDGLLDTEVEEKSDLATASYWESLRALPNDVKEEMYLTIGLEFAHNDLEATRNADSRSKYLPQFLKISRL